MNQMMAAEKLESVFSASIQHRLEALHAFIRGQRVTGGIESRSSAAAREQFMLAMDRIKDRVQRAQDRAVDQADLETSLAPLNVHMFQLARLADTLFMRPADAVPKPVLRFIHSEIESLKLDTLPHLTIGDPGNFYARRSTLWQELFQPGLLGPWRAKKPTDVYVIQIPAVEGYRNLWLPISAGHEVAHLFALESRYFEHPQFVESWLPADFEPAEGLKGLWSDTDTARLAIIEILNDWAREIFCDLYAFKRFGPAAVPALLDILSAAESDDLQFDEGDGHPPVWFRQEVISREFHVRSASPFARMHELWKLRASNRNAIHVPAQEALVKILRDNLDKIRELVESTPTPRYNWRARVKTISSVAKQLSDGFPQMESPSGKTAQDVDILNAGWISVYDPHRRTTLSQLDALVGKAMDTIFYVTENRLPQIVKPLNLAIPEQTSGAVLSAPAILDRIIANAGVGSLEADLKPIRISPMRGLKYGGASIDLRVGRGFIIFRRTATNGVDIRDRSVNPKEPQEHVEKDGNEGFVLHPGELVLAATLEYISLPDDLTGQVVTRSSYGRLGLMTATAMQVHPEYVGCLTLQLVNLGQIPMTLHPGERIAQLVLSRVDPPVPTKHNKYVFAVGPEFSHFYDDRDAG